MGAVSGTIHSFAFVYLSTHLKAPQLLLGLSVAVNSFAECIFLFVSGALTLPFSLFATARFQKNNPICYLRILSISVNVNQTIIAIDVSRLGPIFGALGAKGYMYMAFCAMIVRLSGYVVVGFFGNPWIVLAFDPLHAISFGAFWIAAVSFVQEEAPSGMQ